VVPGLGAKTTIRIARHGPRAGVLGAALLAAQEYGEDKVRDLTGAITSGEKTA
jgi:glucokinase